MSITELDKPSAPPPTTGRKAMMQGASPYMMTALSPFRGIGGLVGMSLDIMAAMVKPPFAWKEFLDQTWFAARVSIVPAILLALPYSISSAFLFNILLSQFGAGDFTGTGTALFTVTQIAPLATIVVTSGASATAMCADLGARTIREEIDAQRVMGIDPIRALCVPRVLAMSVVSSGIISVSACLGMIVGYVLAIFGQHTAPGAFIYSMTLLTGIGDVVLSTLKGIVYGFVAGLIACYKGLNVGGGPAGVGIAVNETCIFCLAACFSVNIPLTAVATQLTAH